MNAYRVSIKAIPGSSFWKVSYIIYVGAARLSSAIKKAHVWAKANQLKKVEVVEVVEIEGNVA